MITVKEANRPDEDICLVVTFDNHSGTYLCDCGSASELTPKECGDAKAIFVTHTHIDHFINFDTIVRFQITTPFRTVVCGPEGLAHSVWAKLQAFNWNLIAEEPHGEMVYEVREYIDSTHYRLFTISSPAWTKEDCGIVESDSLFSNEKFSVTATALDHVIPSIAYRFDEHDTVSINMSNSPFRPGKWVAELKEAFTNKTPDRIIAVANEEKRAEELFNLLSIKEGDSMGFIMDHRGSEANHRKIADHFHNVHQLYIESFYASEEEETALGNAHSTAALSGKAAALAEVREPFPIHFSRKYDAKKREELRNEFYASYDKTIQEITE